MIIESQAWHGFASGSGEGPCDPIDNRIYENVIQLIGDRAIICLVDQSVFGDQLLDQKLVIPSRIPSTNTLPKGRGCYFNSLHHIGAIQAGRRQSSRARDYMRGWIAPQTDHTSGTGDQWVIVSILSISQHCAYMRHTRYSYAISAVSLTQPESARESVGLQAEYVCSLHQQVALHSIPSLSEHCSCCPPTRTCI